MIHKEVTFDKLHEEFRAYQRHGSNAATVLGVASFVCLVADSYADATSTPGFSGFLLSSVHLRNYHGIFFLTIVLQIILLWAGFRWLRRSRWQTATAYSFWILLKEGWATVLSRRKKQENLFGGQRQSFWVLAGLLAACLTGSSLLLWHMERVFLSPVVTVAAIPLAVALGWDLAVVLFVAWHDIYVVTGLVLAGLVIAIGAFYGSGRLVQLIWVPQSIPDFFYWEALLFSLVTLACLLLLLERRQAANILLLSLDPATTPPGANKVPFHGEATGRAVHIMFKLNGVKAVGLYGTNGAKDFSIVNLDNAQLNLPLHGHSLTIWNLCTLEEVASQGAVVTDSVGCFQAPVQLHLMPAAAAFRSRAGFKLEPGVVEFANDVLFHNDQLRAFLLRVGRKVFEEAVQEYSKEIYQIKTRLDSISANFHIAASEPVYTQGKKLDSQMHATIRSAQANMNGRRFLDELSTLRTRLRLAESKARDAVIGCDAIWWGAVRTFIRERIQTAAAQTTANHQVETLLQALGIQLVFGNVTLRGVAAECDPLLTGIEREIVALNAKKDDTMDTAIQHQETLRHDMLKTYLQTQPMGTRQAEDFLERSGALPPKPKEVPNRTLLPDEPEKLN